MFKYFRFDFDKTKKSNKFKLLISGIADVYNLPIIPPIKFIKKINMIQFIFK